MEYEVIHKDIVERCKRGDSRAQFELYRLYSKAMFNICCRMLKSKADAEDVLQNAFVDIFTKLDSFKFQSSIGAWIKRIVVNNCINFLKKRRLNLAELNEQVVSENKEVEKEVDVSDISHLDVKKIKNAMFQLPDGYRIIFSLYLLEGYDHEEISEILGISISTSKSQYSRAKKKMRDLLQKQPLAME